MAIPAFRALSVPHVDANEIHPQTPVLLRPAVHSSRRAVHSHHNELLPVPDLHPVLQALRVDAHQCDEHHHLDLVHCAGWHVLRLQQNGGQVTRCAGGLLHRYGRHTDFGLARYHRVDHLSGHYGHSGYGNMAECLC